MNTINDFIIQLENEISIKENYLNGLLLQTENDLDRAINLPNQNPRKREEKIDYCLKKIEDIKNKIEFDLQKFKKEKQEIISFYKYALQIKEEESLIELKSPYSNSFYLVQENEDVTWSYKPEGSYRISDHWNFIKDGEESIHCRLADTEEPVNKLMVCYFMNGKYYVIKEFNYVETN